MDEKSNDSPAENVYDDYIGIICLKYGGYVNMSKDNLISLDMRMTGKVIKNIIAKRGFTIREIQQKLNLSCPQPVYRWMSGQTMPSLDNLYMLSSILEMHMEDLLMPRNDEMWILHTAKNAGFEGRVKSYLRAVKSNG